MSRSAGRRAPGEASHPGGEAAGETILRQAIIIAPLAAVASLLPACRHRLEETYLLSHAKQVELDTFVANLVNDPGNPDTRFRPERLPMRGGGRQSVQTAFHALLYHEVPAVRRAGVPHIRESIALLHALSDSDAAVREEAFHQLMVEADDLCKSCVADDAIDLALNDRSGEVRKAAVSFAMRRVSLGTLGRAIGLLPAAEPRDFDCAVQRLSEITGRTPHLSQAPTQEALAGNWQAWFESNRDTLRTIGQAKGLDWWPDPWVRNGLGALLAISTTRVEAGGSATLTLTLHNFLDQPVELPAGSRIEFTTGYGASWSDVPIFRKVIELPAGAAIQPYSGRSFVTRSSSLVCLFGEPREALGQRPGLWRITAICGEASFSLRSSSANAICISNTVPLVAGRDLADSLTSFMYIHSDRRNGYAMAPHFPIGTPKAVVDSALAMTRRAPLLTPTGDDVEVAYPFDWQWHWRARFTRERSGPFTLSSPLSFHVGPRPRRPEDVAPADWVRARNGLSCELRSASDALPAGAPAALTIALRNVDTIPHTIPVPTSRYGEHQFLSFIICSETEHWTEFRDQPSSRQEGTRLQDFKRRSGPPAGYCYSFLTDEGKAFTHVSERAKLVHRALPDQKLKQTGNDTKLVTLAPGESFLIQTTLGGMRANHPTGHDTRVDLWRIRVAYLSQAPDGKLYPSIRAVEPWRESNTISLRFVAAAK